MIGLLIFVATSPVSHFDDKAPIADVIVARKMEDIERCLLDVPNIQPPVVYRQPDRPDDVMLLWQSVAAVGGISWRVDLSRQGSRTKVKSWAPAKFVEQCFRDLP